MKKNHLQLLLKKTFVGSMLVCGAFSVANASNNIQLTSNTDNGATYAGKTSHLHNYNIIQQVNNYGNSGEIIVALPNKANGVSHSTYTDFSVGKEGVTIVNIEAKEIIAEVISNRVSNINGNINIENFDRSSNDKAGFYLFNPNGININGGSITGKVSSSSFIASSYLDCNKFSELGNINVSGSVANVNMLVAKNITINNDAYVSGTGSYLTLKAYDNLKVDGSLEGNNIELSSVNKISTRADSNILAKRNLTVHSQEMYLDGYINANNISLGVLTKDEDGFAPRATTNVGLGSNANIYATNNLELKSTDKMLFAHKDGKGARIQATNVDVISKDLQSYLTTINVAKVFKLSVKTSTFHGDKITAGHFRLFDTLMYGDTYNKLRFEDIKVNGVNVKGFQWKETGL